MSSVVDICNRALQKLENGSYGSCDKCGKDLVPTCPICGQPVEEYSRIVGYMRPVSNWNPGKRQEYRDRKEFVIRKHEDHQHGE